MSICQQSELLAVNNVHSIIRNRIAPSSIIVSTPMTVGKLFPALGKLSIQGRAELLKIPRSTDVQSLFPWSSRSQEPTIRLVTDPNHFESKRLRPVRMVLNNSRLHF
jgi:hypothetical protein